MLGIMHLPNYVRFLRAASLDRLVRVVGYSPLRALQCLPSWLWRPFGGLGGPSRAAQPLRAPTLPRHSQETTGPLPWSPVSILGAARARIAFGNFRPPRASRDPTSSGAYSISHERELIGQIKFPHFK